MRPHVPLVAILASKAIAGVLPDILTRRTLEGSADRFEQTHAQRRVRELASSLTRNQVPRKGLGVRVPCPPLLKQVIAIELRIAAPLGCRGSVETQKLEGDFLRCFRSAPKSDQGYPKLEADG